MKNTKKKHNPFPQWPMSVFPRENLTSQIFGREWRIDGQWYDEDQIDTWPLNLYLEYIRGMHEKL